MSSPGLPAQNNEGSRRSMPRKTHCVRGHPRTPDNLTARGSCRTCARAVARRWREAHREYLRAASAKWVREHREHRTKYTRVWRAANPERVAEHNRRRREKAARQREIGRNKR
jgi:hypothetical protein